MRAVLEGICFSLFQIVKVIEESDQPVHTIFANGGFIQSELWLRIMTDVLNKKINVSREGDASAMGAVYMAMMFLGQVKDWNDIKSLVKVDAEFFPDEAVHRVYMRSFAIYEHLYEKLKDDFAKIDLMQSHPGA
jgi:gluconokinase